MTEVNENDTHEEARAKLCSLKPIGFQNKEEFHIWDKLNKCVVCGMDLVLNVCPECGWKPFDMCPECSEKVKEEDEVCAECGCRLLCENCKDLWDQDTTECGECGWMSDEEKEKRDTEWRDHHGP